MNQNYICCKCNQPVKQPCCQLQSPKSATPPEDCPFGYTAEWERSEFMESGEHSHNKTQAKIANLVKVSKARIESINWNPDNILEDLLRQLSALC